jgi:hypothetical protein
MTQTQQPGSVGSFPPTLWSVVLQARVHDSPAAADALAALCRAYWYPLYVYIRLQTASPEQAEDWTQGFFTLLVAEDFLSSVAPEANPEWDLASPPDRFALSGDRERRKREPWEKDAVILRESAAFPAIGR